ncbi:MAG: hypothetical protein JWP25_9029 [Bradyrhizobium sp.]|nr:hypothetical protein [Bradyrhizobium sp.]
MLMVPTKNYKPVKAGIEIQALLEWCFRQELPKRQISSAEGIWRDVAIGAAGTGGDHGSAQRYPHHGLPHDDALLIEQAVADLPLWMCDWAESLPAIMGDLAGLLTVNDLRREQEERGRITQSSWPAKTYSKTERRAQAVNKPRDVIFVGSIDVEALVVSHARQGTRPRWYGEPVTCRKTPSRTDPNRPLIIGECRARDLYTTGSCCPLKWGIPGDKWGDVLVTPFSIATARADYRAWWYGLRLLAKSLVLLEHAPLPPEAPEFPWFDGEREVSLYGQRSPPKMATLPLKPQRKMAGPTRGQGEDVPRRSPGRRIG